MKRFFVCLIRWIYLLTIIASVVYLGMLALHHTAWYKNRLYQQLLSGGEQERLRAASALAQWGGEKHLLQALKAETASVREVARRALEYSWFSAGGDEALKLSQAAFKATEREDYQQALQILDKLVERHPRFAEGWNRRASVYWQLGQFEKSMADCERTLALNPNHYGAWQGLGICQLQLGNVAEACRCLRAALRIIPHDQSTRDSLQRCEELLRLYPPPVKRSKTVDLI